MRLSVLTGSRAAWNRPTLIRQGSLLETAANTARMGLSLVLDRARGVAARVRLPDLLERLLANVKAP